MIISKWLVLAALAGAAAGAACTQETADKAKQGSDTALDAAKEGVEKAAEVTKDVAQKTADQTKEIAAAAGRKTEAVVSATGEAITDGWITTKVSTAFVDESVLKGFSQVPSVAHGRVHPNEKPVALLANFVNKRVRHVIHRRKGRRGYGWGSVGSDYIYGKLGLFYNYHVCRL